MMNFKDKLCGMNSHYRFYSFERFFQEMNRLGIKNVEILTGHNPKSARHESWS